MVVEQLLAVLDATTPDGVLKAEPMRGGCPKEGIPLATATVRGDPKGSESGWAWNEGRSQHEETYSLEMARYLVLASVACVGVLAAVPARAQKCSSFRTCEEAMRSLRSGNTRIDGDGDGIPCEAICGSGRSGSPSQPPGRGRTIQISPATPSAPRRPRPPRPVAPEASGVVALISVGDGDTIRVRNSSGQPVTIRLACIDAPETAQGASGAAATQALRQLLGSGPVEIHPQTVDRYGRTVAEVYAGGRNVNVEMVRVGAAYVYRDYLSGCDQSTYLGAESQAQQYRQGVWRWGNEVKPWDFRRSR
ncbi:putative nuclease domain protein [Cyanobium sp. PCC 7001]|nr:putative nuclease domain protein [Cyanobium sp. PCC 7001]